MSPSNPGHRFIQFQLVMAVIHILGGLVRYMNVTRMKAGHRSAKGLQPCDKIFPHRVGV